MADRDYVNIALALPAGIWEVIGTSAAENGSSPGALIVRALAERYGATGGTPSAGNGLPQPDPEPAPVPVSDTGAEPDPEPDPAPALVPEPGLAATREAARETKERRTRRRQQSPLTV